MLKVYSATFFGLMVGSVISAIKAVAGDLTMTLTVLSAVFGAAFVATLFSIYKPSK